MPLSEKSLKTAFWLHSGLLPKSGEISIFIYSIVYLCAPPWGLCSRSIRIEGREFISFACVSSGSRDWCLPADGGALVTGGDWPAGGRCCWSRSCLLIPVQVSHTAGRIRALKPPSFAYWWNSVKEVRFFEWQRYGTYGTQPWCDVTKGADTSPRTPLTQGLLLLSFGIFNCFIFE